MEGIATQKLEAREHVNLRLTPRSSGHRSLRSRLRPTGAGAANPKPGWHRTTPHCGGAAQLEPRYVLLGRDRAPTDMFYRLSKKGEKWVMYGKKPAGSWESISCDKGCDYKITSDSEIKTYFPADWMANADIACIQNIAQAFCRYNPKGDLTKAGYVVIALVTGKPIPMFLKRVNEQ